MERVRGFWTLSYLLPLLVVMGCSLSTSGQNDLPSTALDTTPPTFSGLSSVTSVDMTRAILSWNPAVDDRSPSANIVYLIWIGNQPGVSTSASPSYVAPPTSTSFEVPSLAPYRPVYFVVRAKDGSRNLETNTVELGTTPTSGRWDFVDGGQASGIDTSDIVRSTAMAAVDNHLFAMWVEAPTSGVMQYCRVAEYNRNDAAPAWNFIDNGPVTGGGLNYDPSRIVGSPYNSITLTPFQSRLYAGWVEYDSISGADQFRVAVYDPALPLSGWKFVEHSPIDHNGINVDVNASASAPNLVAGGGALWAVWEETGAGPSQIRAARYNGNDSSPSWMPIDGGVPTIGINIMSSMQAVNPTAAFYDGHLVAAWIETGYLRAKAYDGNAWVEMDNAGYLNYDPAQSPNNLSMATSTGRLYLSWVENNTAVGTSLARVRAFNGDFSAPLWDFVDGAGDAGINTNVTYSASSPRLVDFNGGLVAIVKEFNGTASQIRVRAFNGDTGSPQWTTIDNGSSSGLNYIVSREAYSAAAVNFQGRLYLSWPETSSGALVEERVIRGM